MAKQTWKPGNMLYPLPAVMVSVTDGEGNDNIITVAWAGTVCTNPPMVSISVRPTRFSYDMICKTKEFVLNLTTEELAYATDYCGVRSNIMDESSDVIYYGEGSEEMGKIAFQQEPEDKCFHLKGVVSRKKQMIPAMMEAAQIMANDFN